MQINFIEGFLSLTN